jgi:hypothetical protein
VISPHNTQHLEQTAEAAGELGIFEIRFQHLMFASSADAFHPDETLRALVTHGKISTPVLRPGALDLSLLKAQLQALRNHPPTIRIRFEPEIRTADLDGYYRNPEHEFRNDCLSPWRRLLVSADGWLGPCQGMCLERYPDTPVLAAWNGKQFRHLRRHILEEGLFRNCLRCCHREYYAQRIGMEVQ